MQNKKSKRLVVCSSTSELDEFRAFLGPLAEDYTVPELRRLQGEMHAMAEILLDFYLIQNNRELPTITF